VNGGRNYNGPKVCKNTLALVKLNYMLETPLLFINKTNLIK